MLLRPLDVIEHGEKLTGNLRLGQGDRELAVALHPAAVVAVLGGDALQIRGPFLHLSLQRIKLGGPCRHTGSRDPSVTVVDLEAATRGPPPPPWGPKLTPPPR